MFNNYVVLKCAPMRRWIINGFGESYVPDWCFPPVGMKIYWGNPLLLSSHPLKRKPGRFRIVFCTKWREVIRKGRYFVTSICQPRQEHVHEYFWLLAKWRQVGVVQRRNPISVKYFTKKPNKKKCNKNPY